MNGASGSPLLSLRGARFGYRPGVPIVEEATLDLFPGDFVLLTGANGSGKSTLIRGLLGLTPWRDGRVAWGVPREQVGYVPQEAFLEAGGPATALDVVRCALPFAWGGGRENAGKALARVGLPDRAGTPFAHLSGGQKRRVLVARALAAEPAVILLDEPTANVDDETAARLETLLEDLCRREGRAVVAAIHDAGWGRSARRLRMEAGVLRG